MRPDDIPVIDLAPFRDGSGCQDIADRIGQACTEIGFFYIAGHGVAGKTIGEAVDRTKAFFALPEAEKRAVAVRRDRYRGFIPLAAFSPNDGQGARDRYEGYKVHLDLTPDHPLVRDGVPLYGANVWPAGQPAFRAAIDRYFDALDALSRTLLRAFAAALGLPAGTFAGHFAAPLSNLSLLHYPPAPADGAAPGIHAHRDTDAFTILLPDPVGGLEVARRDGAWIAAPVIDGTFLVNIGNMMECWTGGRFRSTPHRVVNRTGRERYSIAFFSVPDYGTVVRPLLPETAAEAATPIPAEIAVGPFMERLYQTNWA